MRLGSVFSSHDGLDLLNDVWMCSGKVVLFCWIDLQAVEFKRGFGTDSVTITT